MLGLDFPVLHMEDWTSASRIFTNPIKSSCADIISLDLSVFYFT